MGVPGIFLTAIDTKGKTGGGENVGDKPWFLTPPAEGAWCHFLSGLVRTTASSVLVGSGTLIINLTQHYKGG